MFGLVKGGHSIAPMTEMPNFNPTTRPEFVPISIGSFAAPSMEKIQLPEQYKMNPSKVASITPTSKIGLPSQPQPIRPTIESVIHKVNNLPSYVPSDEITTDSLNNAKFYIDNGKLRTDNAFINAVMDLESYGGRLDAKNVKTGAFGPVQFLKPRLQDISRIVGNNFVYDASDVDSNATAIKAHFTDYINRLNKLGIPATPENLYYIHQQGFGGFLNLYKNMDSNLYDTLGETKFNSRILNNIPEDLRKGIDTSKFTGRDFMNIWANRFNSKYGEY